MNCGEVPARPADADDQAWANLPFTSQWRQVAVYQYRLLDGSVAFQHVRWASRHLSGRDPIRNDAKRFTFRHSTPCPCHYSFPGGVRQTYMSRPKTPTSDGLPPGAGLAVEHLIYRLPEIALAAAINAWCRPLIICEGEKDAEACESLGWLATTANDGATSWGVSSTRWLVAAGWTGPIVIAIDNDEMGWLHGYRTLAALSQVAAASEGELDWPIAVVRSQHGKDVADGVAAGLGVDNGPLFALVPLEEVLARGASLDARDVAGEQLKGSERWHARVGSWRDREMATLIERGDW